MSTLCARGFCNLHTTYVILDICWNELMHLFCSGGSLKLTQNASQMASYKHCHTSLWLIHDICTEILSCSACTYRLQRQSVQSKDEKTEGAKSSILLLWSYNMALWDVHFKTDLNCFSVLNCWLFCWWPKSQITF